MATKTKRVEQGYDGSSVMYSWRDMANGDSGEPIDGAEWGDRAVQVVGTFGAGGTIVWEGSNDGTNYVTLKDSFNVATSFTAAGIATVIDVPRYCRPRVTAGDGTTSLSVYALSRRPEQIRRVVTDSPMTSL